MFGYCASKKTFEIAIKIFSDDLQLAISNEINKEVEIGTEREVENADELIQNYIQNHFNLLADKTKIKLNYIGRELIEKEFFAMWIYLEAENIEDFKELMVFNTVLIEEHNTQQNDIFFKKGERVQRKTTHENTPFITFD